MKYFTSTLFLTIFWLAPVYAGPARIWGRVLDPQGKIVSSATVNLQAGVSAKSDEFGRYSFAVVPPGTYELMFEAPGLSPTVLAVTVRPDEPAEIDLRFTKLARQNSSIVISDRTVEPDVDVRNTEVFTQTLFTRDDQAMQQLNAGISAGQHEGGGKSLEIRRFGFNLDHGGVNGGLKVLVDNVQQNQGTQGHGQGYLGALKSLSPELIDDVTIINGPFSAQYGDFSGLGVVHIRQREALGDQYTIRLQGGNFDTGRGFLAFSPDVQNTDAYFAYEGSYTNGPFESPSEYRRDNVNANYTRRIGDDQKLGFRLLYGHNNFNSSGQPPLDLVDSGELDQFGYLDPTNGGKVKLGTLSTYYSKTLKNGDSFRADGFISRSLFDLFSNFTFYLSDPVAGDAIQQHDSRLQEGGNAQYTHLHRIGSASAMLVSGGNFHDNQINVGLYPREARTPTGVTLRSNAHVTNGAGFVQESISLWRNKLLLTGGLRYDVFRYGLVNQLDSELSGTQIAGRWQGKGAVALTPSNRIPLTFHANYGRGINSVDARAVAEHPENPRLATTDFYQFGTSSHFGRVGISTDVFLIDHSNEQVYIPDDGTYELKGASRAYGYEAKASVHLTRYLSLNGGLTKIGNAFFRGGETRVYVDSAPHFVANAALTLSSWRGWSGSLRMRAISQYRLDGEDPSVAASGHTVFDLGVTRRIRSGMDFNFSLDNLTSRDYFETQNYFESRVTPYAPIVSRIHATPGFPLTVVVGVTFRLGGK